jgi:hypothetical protein
LCSSMANTGFNELAASCPQYAPRWRVGMYE